MKKGLIALTAIAVIGVSSLAIAEMEGKKEGMGKGMMGKEGMMGKMEMMHGMKGMMNKPSMVASNDGGVIILSGNKLSKYDAKLNLVKEAEIKAESQGDGKMCGMCKMMGKGMGMMEGQEEAEEATDAPAVKEEDHKAHH